MIFPKSRYPYSSFTEINLDWICRKLTELETRLNEIDPGSATGIVAIEHGGTGADNAADALDNLGVDYPVKSVNSKTGHVVLDASDVGALPDTYTPPAAPVDSVNGNTGAVVLSFGDVGAIGIYKGPNAVAGGTAYDLTGTDYNNFLIIVGSPNGANNNTILYANLTYDKIRLLGNVASDLTVSISSGIVTIASANYQANVWICPLTD